MMGYQGEYQYKLFVTGFNLEEGKRGLALTIDKPIALIPSRALFSD